MTDYETTWDKRLHINTTGRDDSNADEYRYPMSPHHTAFWSGWLAAA